MGRSGEEGGRSPPSAISAAGRFAETERVIGRRGGLMISTDMFSSLELSNSSSSASKLSIMAETRVGGGIPGTDGLAHFPTVFSAIGPTVAVGMVSQQPYTQSGYAGKGVSPRKTILSASGQAARPLLSRKSDRLGSMCPFRIAGTRLRLLRASSTYGHTRSPSCQLELSIVEIQGCDLAKWPNSCGMRARKKLFISGIEPFRSNSKSCRSFGDVIPRPSRTASWTLWMLGRWVLDANRTVPNYKSFNQKVFPSSMNVREKGLLIHPPQDHME